MKKKTITIGALLLAMNSFSQIDTLANSINGKNKYEFNYYTNEIKNVVKPKKYQDFIFTIKKNNYLYVDLFDDMERDTLYLMYRNITIYYRDGDIKREYYNSNDNTLQINGKFVRKIIVHKPELK